MQIPYMKIAIYALTFLTYAYSGYGANIISSLRDAIIAAEAIFGDVFKNVITVVQKFKIVHEVFDAAVDETCEYKCPNGLRPVKNKLHTPTSDGCGALGLKISSEYLPHIEMEKCCEDHDICYSTCYNDKELCDLEFKRCLYKYCDSYEKIMATDFVVRGCKAAAKMLFTGTLTLGCKSYLDAQEKACFCPATSSTSDQSKHDRQKYDKSAGYNKKGFKEKPPFNKNYGWREDL